MTQPPPYWAVAWPGGQALTRFLIDHPDWVRGKRVLDFAAGSGLSAIGASKVCAALTQAADIDDFSIAATALNGRISDVVIDLVREDLIGVAPPCHVLVAVDCCYARPMAEMVIAWFRVL